MSTYTRAIMSRNLDMFPVFVSVIFHLAQAFHLDWRHAPDIGGFNC